MTNQLKAVGRFHHSEVLILRLLKCPNRFLRFKPFRIIQQKFIHKFKTMHQNFMKNAPYTVMAEDHCDYYQDPPIRYKLFEASTYYEAVAFAMDYYDKCEEDDLQWPNVTALRIVPEAVGMSFNYEKYMEYVCLEKFNK
jgi:hypothetical protein